MLNVCQSAEAVMFQFDNPVRIIESLRSTRDRQWLETWLHNRQYINRWGTPVGAKTFFIVIYTAA